MGRKANFRDTTQIDRIKAIRSIKSSRDKRAVLITEQTAFFRRLRSVFHQIPAAVFTASTALCEQDKSDYSLHHCHINYVNYYST